MTPDPTEKLREALAEAIDHIRTGDPGLADDVLTRCLHIELPALATPPHPCEEPSHKSMADALSRANRALETIAKRRCDCHDGPCRCPRDLASIARTALLGSGPHPCEECARTRSPFEPGVPFLHLDLPREPVALHQDRIRDGGEVEISIDEDRFIGHIVTGSTSPGGQRTDWIRIVGRTPPGDTCCARTRREALGEAAQLAESEAAIHARARTEADERTDRLMRDGAAKACTRVAEAIRNNLKDK